VSYTKKIETLNRKLFGLGHLEWR